MIKVGILGGGQLGRMLLQAAANYPCETHVMEKEADCPAASLCHHFQPGDIRDYDSVLSFGRKLDAITIEIEQVNVDALEQLEREGVTIIPRPAVLRIIQDKIQQKEFYRQQGLPTAPFRITQNRSELSDHLDLLPAVHKLGMGGYDGRGVTLIREESDIAKGFDEPSVLEKMIDIEKEIAVSVAVDPAGNSIVYPAVEMVFNPTHNLLDYQICPASISTENETEAASIARDLVKALGSPGFFAVEMFLSRDGKIWINEVAPRVHNSGHHTIEAHYSSQFDMLWRILMDLPLGNPKAILPSVMVNLIGSEGQSGVVVYEGLESLLQLPNANLHLYGKKETRPGRKMGHVTLIGPDTRQLADQAAQIKTSLRIRAEK